MSSLKADNVRDPQRKIKIAIVLLFLLSAAIFGTMFYLQAKAKTSVSSATEKENKIGAVVLANPQKQQSAKIAQAKLLRDKWRSWALQHRQELKQMLGAQPSDENAWKIVWDKVPAWSTATEGGITDTDLNLIQAPFSWNAVEKAAKSGREDRAATPTENAEDAAARQFAQKQLKDDFVALNDVRISESVDTGTSTISLWASGRVTESKWIPQTVVGQPAFIKGPEQGIEPPYDFLR